jgi:plasmid stabilization system protein ParE
MAYKVRWTPEADESFHSILTYLEENWTEREIINFVKKTNHLLTLISQYPEMFKSSYKKPVRVANITRQTNLFYQIIDSDNTIILLSFWDNRQNPESLNY